MSVPEQELGYPLRATPSPVWTLWCETRAALRDVVRETVRQNADPSEPSEPSLSLLTQSCPISY